MPPLPGVTPATTLVPYSIACCAWNDPFLPVMPCTRTRVVSSTKTAGSWAAGWRRKVGVGRARRRALLSPLPPCARPAHLSRERAGGAGGRGERGPPARADGGAGWERLAAARALPRLQCCWTTSRAACGQVRPRLGAPGPPARARAAPIAPPRDPPLLTPRQGRHEQSHARKSGGGRRRRVRARGKSAGRHTAAADHSAAARPMRLARAPRRPAPVRPRDSRGGGARPRPVQRRAPPPRRAHAPPASVRKSYPSFDAMIQEVQAGAVEGRTRGGGRRTARRRGAPTPTAPPPPSLCPLRSRTSPCSSISTRPGAGRAR